jgi:hypothetical protein
MTDDRPVELRIVKGAPTEDELAALVAAVSTRRTPSGSAPERMPASNWAAYWRSVRTPLPHGPNAWRASARPC